MLLGILQFFAILCAYILFSVGLFFILLGSMVLF